MDEIIREPILGIIRIPITGINRMPIVGIPTEDTGEELSWDEIYEQLVNYIKFAAKQVSGQYQTGVVYSAEDLFQEGQLVLYDCYLKYKHKPMNQFSALFKTSLWRKLRELGRKPQFIQVNIEDAYDIGYSDSVVEELYEEYKLQQLAEMLESQPIALTILKEFINPSSRTVWEAKQDVARKEMLKSQNFNISVPKSVSIKGVHIQRALEIPKTTFTENFKIVKNLVNQVYRTDADDNDELTDEEFNEILRKYA